ncbi:hypothetical protein QN355_13090 [Cryobacterium sp. 10S3]|uniref:hypothetical protein n=1 Tax=Cryobacterium sp. 10S3 TaxID=3048582 RepID=UPI002AC92A18|nr:hypothetical protein [Cryobacterium sp. 10S3]MEB0287487.1 hypothetical protein [Cryobacterium sp. 10S3]WPX13289.1 hypothetical protein RHM57_16700 [Cryobacterium sp. 10S3]
MMNNYSSIVNPSLTGLGLVRATRTIERGNARAFVKDRLFHVAGGNVFEVAGNIDPNTSAVVVSGAYGHRRAKILRDTHPGLPLIIEPTSIGGYVATVAAPFQIPEAEENELFPPTLDSILDSAIAHGSVVAMTPTGQIDKGDSATLKAALALANEIDRNDVVFLLNLSAGWLSDDFLRKQIVAVINRSRHPVALAFIDRKNPIESGKRLRAYRSIFIESTNDVIAYRTDMAGFDARAHGAIAAAIGALPSARRVTPKGKGGRASDPTDLAPHMLVADLGRFAKSKMMRNVWFIDRPGITCSCAACHGRSIDRLFEMDEDRAEGHLHNVYELERMHAATVGMTQVELHAWWHEFINGVLGAYPQLETYINRPISVPADVVIWNED